MLKKSDKVLKLQTRKAKDLPHCALSRAIETHLGGVLRASGTAADDVVVLLVSDKSYTYIVMPEMKERYGDSYPDR